MGGLATGLLLRATSLRGLPDIGDPFDVSAYGTVDLTDEQNAFTFYRRAHEAFQKEGTPTPLTMKGSYSLWSEVTPENLAFLERKRAALMIWLEGTKHDRGVQVQPRLHDASTRLYATQTLREFLRLANLEGFRLERNGDFPGAWTWYRANLRASHHSGQHGNLIERLVGLSHFEPASQQAIRWSDNHAVDAQMLRRALGDAIAMEAIAPSNRALVRNMHIEMMNTLSSADVRDRGMAEMTNAADSITPKLLREIRIGSTFASFLHEPERSRRVVRLLTANWLPVIDLPASERSKRAFRDGDLVLFLPGPGQSSPIPLDELARWFRSTRYMRVYYRDLARVERALAREERNRAALIVHLAEQLFLRERGQAPGSAEELVGPYLKELPVGFGSPTALSKSPGSPR